MGRKKKDTIQNKGRGRVYNYKINGVDYGYDGYDSLYGKDYADYYSDYYGGYNYGNYGYTGKGVYGSSSTATPSVKVSKTNAIDISEIKNIVEDPTDALVRKMAAQRMKIYESHEAALADEDRPDDCYFPARNGWGVLRTRIVDGNRVMFVGTSKTCPLLPEAPIAVGIDIVNKIPKELFQEVVASFYDVYKKYHKEAAAQIWRKKDGNREYFVVYPKQKISGASVSFDNDTPEMAKVREEADRVVDCHSHHSMSAFWSGVDDSDEQTADCFRMVIGHMGTTKAGYLLRIKYEDTYRNFPACELFDMTQEEEDEILTVANIPEGNGEILKHIDTSYTTSSKSYSWNYGVTKEEKERIIKHMKTAKDVIYPGDPESRDLWKLAERDPETNTYYSCGYKFLNYKTAPDGKVGWRRVEGTKEKENETSDANKNEESTEKSVMLTEGATSNVAEEEFVKPTPKEVASRRMSAYLFTVGRLFSGDKVTSTGDSEAAGGLVDYLCGCADSACLNGSKPESEGVIVLPGNLDKAIDDLKADPDLDEETIQNIVTLQAKAKLQVQMNVEEACDFFGGTSMKVDTNVLNESEIDFVNAVLSTVDERMFTRYFSPAVMWELMTFSERQKLATVFGLTTYEMGSAMHNATVNTDTYDKNGIHYVTALLLHKFVVMSEDDELMYAKVTQGNEIRANGVKNIINNFNKYVIKEYVNKEEND